MNTKILLISAALILSSIGMAQFRPPGRPPGQASQVCFFRDANYMGQLFCLNEGDSAWDLAQWGANDTVSSIAFYGYPFEITVYEDSNMRGRALRINSNVSNLDGWMNDRISSVSTSLNRQPPRPPPPQGSVCFYEDSYYRGNSLCLQQGEYESNFDRRGFNDKASSIRFFGSARSVRVWVDSDGRGYEMSFDRDMPNLDRIMNDQISSAQVR